MPAQLGVDRQGLAELGADPHHRIERHHRILKHHRNAIAAQCVPALGIGLAQIFAVEQDFAADHVARGIDQVHQ